ncbi:MAG: hypothetical protein OEY33_02855 [Bdellovibrionales bacterium]|nr:hypothetical protein [Bdellovibrionales bacterium]
MKTLITIFCLTLAFNASAFFGGNLGQPDMQGLYKSSITTFDNTPFKNIMNQTSLTGVLKTNRMAIGGETYGMVLKTDEGTFELQFKNKSLLDLLRNDGKRIEVYGDFIEISSVERGKRKVFEVIDYLTLD